MIYVIGAGPAGLFLAISLKKLDHLRKIIIFEDHKDIGSPVQCTGILTPAITELFPIKKEMIANKIRTAKIYAPKGNHVTIRFNQPDFILHRNAFDQSLEKEARKQGVQIKKEHRLTHIKGSKLIFSTKKKMQVQIKLKERDIVIGADGPQSTVAKQTGMFTHRQSLLGNQALVKINNDNAIGFYPHIGEYAWFAPENMNFSRIGIATRKNHAKLFKELLARFPGKIISRQAGLIPLYHPKIPKQTIHRGVQYFLIGDAAGQIKNTTGGGIIAGMKAGKLLAELIHEGRQEEYAKKVKKLEQELYLHYRLNKGFGKFTDEDWNKLVEICSKKGMRELLGKINRDNLISMIPPLFIHGLPLIRFWKKFVQ